MNDLLDLEVELWLIWYRPPGARKWSRAGRCGSYAEALTLVGGAGAWRVTRAR